MHEHIQLSMTNTLTELIDRTAADDKKEQLPYSLG
jgi:hypothetical protein